MQLTSFTDYALRTLIFLASLPEDELTNITEVTDLFGVSRNHMVKVINRLGQLGYVHTVRGKNGGIRLMKPASEITVGGVVRDLEPLDLVNCGVDFAILPPLPVASKINWQKQKVPSWRSWMIARSNPCLATIRSC